MKVIITCVILVCLINIINGGQFFFRGGRKYYVSYPLKKNWYLAQQYCTYNGMYLVDINSEAENNRILSIITGPELANVTEKTYWTSGNDLGSEGQFYWASTGRPLIFTDWATNGQPDNAGGRENCVEIRGPFGFKWNDHICDLPKHFICRNVADFEHNCCPNVKPLCPLNA